jgi:hypothetical protein
MSVKYIANPRPAECLAPAYSCDQSATWVAAAGSQEGPQPISDSNPNGTYGAIPAMSLTAASAALLAGPQPSNP